MSFAVIGAWLIAEGGQLVALAFDHVWMLIGWLVLFVLIRNLGDLISQRRTFQASQLFELTQAIEALKKQVEHQSEQVAQTNKRISTWKGIDG